MTPYGDTALDAELAAMRQAANGGRNKQLNRSAFAVAQLVAGRQLDGGAARRALQDAAKAAGLDAREIAGTLDSGWNAGLAEPRAPERAANDQGPRGDDRARDVAAWEYADVDGVTLYRKVRMALPDGGKSYRVERPDGRGGWMKGRGGHAVPYRLPEIARAPGDAVLYMAEGEKHADKLADWGLLATSLKDWSPKFAGHVAGRTVVIFPDNDQAGAEHAERARRMVETAGGRAVLVDLPGLAAGGDIMDWDGDAPALAALVDAALRAPTPTESAGPALLELEDTADWAGVAIPARRWLIDGWLPVGEAAFLTGPGAVGKSLVAQQLAATLAAGKPFMGVGTMPATSLYITCEDGPDELRRRQASIAAMLGGHAERGRCLAASWKGQLDLELFAYDADRRLRPTSRFDALRATALAIGARLIVLDNTSHLFGGDENVKREVAAFVNLLNGLAAEIDGVVLLLGHPNKSGVNDGGASTGNQFGGSVAWENQVRSRLFLATDGEDPDARVLSNPKSNYARKGEGRLCFRWHKGAFVRIEDLGEDAARELHATAAAGHDNSLFLACLAKATTDKRAVSHVNGSNYAPRILARMVEAQGVKPERFAAAMERLLHLGTIRLDQPLWRGENRHWKHGIALASDCANPDDAIAPTSGEGAPTPAPTPAPTMCADPRRPPSQVTDNYAPTLCAMTPLYPAGKQGGALGVPPPCQDSEGEPPEPAAGDWYENPALGSRRADASGTDPDDWTDLAFEDDGT